MKSTTIHCLVYLLIFAANCRAISGKLNAKINPVIENINDLKDFKKLLRSKTNILILFTNNVKKAVDAIKVFRDAALVIRGIGTMALVDCSLQEKHNLCKKVKVLSNALAIKHYHNGEFNKDYDRQMTATSMLNFMRDPTGDLPWDEDPIGKDVIHFADYLSFMKYLKKDLRPMLVMFHVPWCGFCRRLKPEFSKAASELVADGYTLAAMDVEKQDNAVARRFFNITSFPTIIYFDNGNMKQIYEGENNKNAFVTFMRDPSTMPLKKQTEADWSIDANSEIVHLTKQGFEPALKDENSVLVMFYAPWCGHCKRLKPEYEKAAIQMKEHGIPGVLAALDATKETSISEQFNVEGYPTLKYFVNGNYKFDVNVRDAEKIVQFMKNPKEPPTLAPSTISPPEQNWRAEADTEVIHLNNENFALVLKRKKHALVMFYAPWCGHCKSTKPEFKAASKALANETRVVFAVVDCTQETNICNKYEVRGYPTIKYFSYMQPQVDYNGARKRGDFIVFLQNLISIGGNKMNNEL